MFVYNTLMKIAINEHNMNPLDLALIRSFVMMVFVMVVGKATK